MLTSIIFTMLIGYTIGSLHGSVIAGTLAGVNVRKLGTNNAGASNTFIELGKGYGIFVALFDSSKGIVAIFLTASIARTFDWPVDSFFLATVAGASAVIGHNFPIWLRFKGGKGTATMVGMLLALDWQWGLFAFMTFIIVTWLTDYIVIGALMLYLVLIVETLAFHSVSSFFIALSLLATMIIVHQQNFHRIHLNTETRVSEAFSRRKKDET